MNKYHRKFPVYRDVTCLVTEIEKAVQTFPGYHKYTLGSEMRRTAYHCLLAITMAINETDERYGAVKQAHRYSETLKIQIQLAKNITTMSFKLFERLAGLVVSVSKQCKSWQKSLQRPHQNEPRYV